MIGLALLVAAIAVADSLNPSTVVPALYLAAAPRGRGLVSFTLGVFAVSLAGGLVLVLGPGPALIAELRAVGPQTQHVGEAVVGVALLTFALLAWRSRCSGETAARRTPRAHTRTSAFVLGAGIMAIELPTAFMYVGVVSAILVSSSAVAVEVGLVVLYNALFVLPLVLLVVLRTHAGERAERRIAEARERVRSLGPRALAAVMGAAGAALASIGVGGLLVSG